MIIVDHWRIARKLGLATKSIVVVPSFLLACAILALGLFLFATIITRMEVF